MQNINVKKNRIKMGNACELKLEIDPNKKRPVIKRPARKLQNDGDETSVLSQLNELNKVNLYRDNERELDHVLKSYDDLYESYSDNEYILIHKGICQQYLQDYKGAAELYMQVLKKNPNNLEARILLEGCMVISSLDEKKRSINKGQFNTTSKKYMPDLKIFRKDKGTEGPKAKEIPDAVPDGSISYNENDPGDDPGNEGDVKCDTMGFLNGEVGFGEKNVVSQANVEKGKTRINHNTNSIPRKFITKLNIFRSKSTDEESVVHQRSNQVNEHRQVGIKKNSEDLFRSPSLSHIEKSELDNANISPITSEKKDLAESIKDNGLAITIKSKILNSTNKLLEILNSAKNRVIDHPEDRIFLPYLEESTVKWLKLEKQSLEDLIDKQEEESNSDGKNNRLLKKVLNVFDNAGKLLESEDTSKVRQEKNYRTVDPYFMDNSDSFGFSTTDAFGDNENDLLDGRDSSIGQNSEYVDIYKGPTPGASFDYLEHEANNIEKRQKARSNRKMRTFNLSLDKLLGGGIATGSNILVEGPSFVNKDVILYKFATIGMRMDLPIIIINPETPPDTIRKRFEQAGNKFKDLEENGKVFWLDPESEDFIKELKEIPGDYELNKRFLLIDKLESMSSEILARYNSYILIFFNLSPLIIFQEPKTINNFINSISLRIKKDNAIGFYTIDNAVHDTRDLNFVKRVMNGIIEIKKDSSKDGYNDPRTLIKVDKFSDARSYDWHEYISTTNNYDIKEIIEYNKVM